MELIDAVHESLGIANNLIKSISVFQIPIPNLDGIRKGRLAMLQEDLAVIGELSVKLTDEYAVKQMVEEADALVLSCKKELGELSGRTAGMKNAEQAGIINPSTTWQGYPSSSIKFPEDVQSAIENASGFPWWITILFFL